MLYKNKCQPIDGKKQPPSHPIDRTTLQFNGPRTMTFSIQEEPFLLSITIYSIWLLYWDQDYKWNKFLFPITCVKRRLNGTVL